MYDVRYEYWKARVSGEINPSAGCGEAGVLEGGKGSIKSFPFSKFYFERNSVNGTVHHYRSSDPDERRFPLKKGDIIRLIILFVIEDNREESAPLCIGWGEECSYTQATNPWTNA